MMVVAFSAFAEGVSTDTTSIASPSVDFTAVQSVTGQTTESSYGMGVRCSEPTLSAEHIDLGSGAKGYTVGVSIGLGSAFDFDNCEKSARQVRWIREQQRMDIEHTKQKRDEMHDIEIATKRMRFYNEFCKPGHGSMSLDKNTYEYKLCTSVAFLFDQHVKGMNTRLMPVGHGRVSPTQGSWGD